jgi:hypothetical protein
MPQTVKTGSNPSTVRWRLLLVLVGVFVVAGNAPAETPADEEIRAEADPIIARAGEAHGMDPSRNPEMARADSGSVFNPRVNFRSYKRFAFSDRPEDDLAEGKPGERVGNPFVIKEIQRVVYSEMINRGYYPAPASEADFLVSLQIGGHSRSGYYIDRVGYNSSYDQFYSAWGSYGATLVIPTTYKKGTLLIDIVDIGLKELSWQGWSSEPVGPEKNREEIIRKVVKDIIDRFPPNG